VKRLGYIVQNFGLIRPEFAKSHELGSASYSVRIDRA
jgi:hypothetical protein